MKNLKPGISIVISLLILLVGVTATAADELKIVYNVGVAPLKEYHLYSHVGRGQGTWGEPITLDHRFVIVFTVEMAPGLIRNAPMVPAIADHAAVVFNTRRLGLNLARSADA